MGVSPLTDRLHLPDGTHKDYAAIVIGEVSLTCYTFNGDVDFYGHDEASRVIRSVERYQGNGESAESMDGDEEHPPATDSPSQATEADGTDDTTQPRSVPMEGRAEIQQAMLDAGIDLDDVSVLHVPSDEVYRIELADGVDDYDAIDAWTDSRFGKDNPGYIDWTEYEKDDGSTGYYPDAYCVPYDALEDVVSS